MSHKNSMNPTLAALGGLLAIASTRAEAQDAPPPRGSPEILETVTVTGSRIRREDYVSDSPTVTVDAAAMSESGSTAIEHLLNTLPQFVPSLTTTSNNPA